MISGQKNLRKIFFIIIITAAASAAGFFIWWPVFFVPDDFDISRKEALLPAGVKIPEIMAYSMIENIDSAVLSGDWSAGRIGGIAEKLRKNGFCIRSESFIRAKRNNMIFRFGTGYAGIWLDERSSVILPADTSLSYKISILKNSRLEFSCLSPEKAGTLIVEITQPSSPALKKTIELPGYRNHYGAKDAAIKLNNRGFPKALDDVAWADFSIDLPGLCGAGAVVRFIMDGGDGCAFIANPRIFEKSERKRYNVIYVLMDGISNPYYNMYNSRSNLTPYTDNAAKKDFIIFNNMITVGDKTRISVSGLFTSEMPFKTRHGINRNFIPEAEKELFYNLVRGRKLDSMPDVFRRAGYISTQIGNSGFTVHLLSTGVDYGFDRSFEFSVNPYNSYGLSHRLFEFLGQNRGREFFLYLHYNTPHKPFFTPISYYFKGLLDSPPEAWWRPDFNATVRYSDDVFSHVYEALKHHNLLEDTIVVFASDHGAGIYVTRFDAGTQYMEYLRIPFMIHLPQKLEERYHINKKRIESYTSSINIAPTLTELAGLPVPQAFSGRSLVPLMNSSNNNIFFDNEIWCFGRKQSSVITPDMFKYTLTSADASRLVNREYYSFGEEREVPFELLYDIKNDPLEEHNLILDRPDMLKKMRRLYLDRDFHHPERTILAFFPAGNEKKIISVEAECASPFISSELYDIKAEVIKDALRKSSSGAGMNYSFKLPDRPVYLILENEDDRAPVKISVRENGHMVDPRDIFTTYLNLNISGNPAFFKDKNDFLLLYETRLPKESDFYNDNSGAVRKSSLRVKILRMDLHRW
ncbi:MAG: sulfatase-like hydrolase/transferase, partial [Spirochaetes bacterium]|nr:sulfatase-like hydrolase/transferase [Spirochaetota bacterium]